MNMMKIKKLLFSIAVLPATLVTSGQEAPGVLALSLQEAIDYALSYNKTLKNARLDVEQSRRSIWESIAQGLPQVDGSLDYMTYFNYELEFSFGMVIDAIPVKLVAGPRFDANFSRFQRHNSLRLADYRPSTHDFW